MAASIGRFDRFDLSDDFRPFGLSDGSDTDTPRSDTGIHKAFNGAMKVMHLLLRLPSDEDSFAFGDHRYLTVEYRCSQEQVWPRIGDVPEDVARNRIRF